MSGDELEGKWALILGASSGFGAATSRAKQFAMGECTIFLAKEKIGNDRPVMHLAISCKSRYPNWDEVLRARFMLLQDGMDVAIFLPKTRSQMKNMENCFHLWQVNFVNNDPQPDQKKG